MSWIVLRAKVFETDEDLLIKGFPKNNPDIVWADKAIRTEEIVELEELTPNRVLISFYAGHKLIVQGKLAELVKKLQAEDYPDFLQEVEDPNAIK